MNQLFFVLGSLVVAVVLVFSLHQMPGNETSIVQSPLEALKLAEQSPALRGHQIGKVDTIELVKGADPRRLSDATWHVQIELAAPKPKSQSDDNQRTVDHYISPTEKVPPHAAAVQE